MTDRYVFQNILARIKNFITLMLRIYPKKNEVSFILLDSMNIVCSKEL